MKRFIKYFMLLFVALTTSVSLASCSDDDDKEPTNSIVGTWYYSESNTVEYDEYTLVFNKDHTGYICNEYGSRASETMNFDWATSITSDGFTLLSVVYKSGDRYVDGPFSGGFAQYNRIVTVAGTTLSISMNDNYVMIFSRNKTK